MKKATYTTILHEQFRSSDLTLHEYVVCDVIDKLANPWCFMKRKNMAEMLKLSERGLIGIVKRLHEEGWVEKNEKGELRASPKWKDTFNIEHERSASKKEDMNAVHVEDAPSAPETHERSASLYIYNSSYNNKDTLSHDCDSVVSDAPIREEVAAEDSPKRDKLKELPFWLGKSWLHRVVGFYSLIWENMYGFKPDIAFPKIGRLFKPLQKQLSEFQIAALIVTHFEWMGADGQNQFANNQLHAKCFPLDWVPAARNPYEAYLRNVMKLDFDDPEKVKEYVVNFIKPYLPSSPEQTNA